MTQIRDLRVHQIHEGTRRTERLAALAAAIAPLGVDLVITENESADGAGGVMSSMPVSTVDSSDLGLDPATTGLANASTKVRAATVRPPRSAGVKVGDDGNAAAAVTEFLVAARLI